MPLIAGEIYIWTDKKGVEHITTTPPPENAKVRHREKYQQTNQWEIDAYERQRKAAADRMDREDRVKRRANEYDQSLNKISESYKDSSRKRDIEQAKESLRREEFKERLRRFPLPRPRIVKGYTWIYAAGV